MSNQRMFSRLASIGRSEKINDIEMKNAFVKSSLTWWANDFKNDFVPPPPRPPFLEEPNTDGLTCDLCTWAWTTEKSFYSDPDTSNDFMWIILLIIVSFSSAIIGAVAMTLKYKRAFAVRNCGAKKQSTDQLCSAEHKQNEMKMSPPDLKWDNTDNDEIYATLNECDGDQDSTNSDNMNTYQKSVYKGDDQQPSAPSSAYYSDMSRNEEKYECIDSFNSFDKTEFCNSGNTFITLNNNNIVSSNRLSAISEHNFSSQNQSLV